MRKPMPTHLNIPVTTEPTYPDPRLNDLWISPEALAELHSWQYNEETLATVLPLKKETDGASIPLETPPA
jgi:hypothetical protein